MANFPVQIFSGLSQHVLSAFGKTFPWPDVQTTPESTSCPLRLCKQVIIYPVENYRRVYMCINSLNKREAAKI